MHRALRPNRPDPHRWRSQAASRFLYCILISLTFSNIRAGEVILVIGSDTAIWQGMDTGRHRCHYNIDLYTNPARNAYRVMDPAFRAGLTDSFGRSMPLTWWMMAGNIFRYADNTNVPIPNIMTLYLMKKYHGENILANEDELTLHYHTFFWSDYDGDGRYYWNQSQTFLECYDDFFHTLAQFLLDEETFPVSFRSGWHYMDNDWQRVLDNSVLPYSLHNDYPAKKTFDTEPIDNIYDWSQAPPDFIAYRPDSENYQVPGSGPGWNMRSASFSKTRSRNLIDSLFIAADDGPDQILCIWGHLPETDFLDNLEYVNEQAHQNAALHPGVPFRYCTAIEAFQRWRKTEDLSPPDMDFLEDVQGDRVSFIVRTDEPIFQTQPFVAVKDVYERYTVLECIRSGESEWRTENIEASRLARAGVAVCDTLGNQSLRFIDYLPADIFIDNLDAGYTETLGAWSTDTQAAWGIDSRQAVLAAGDSAAATWTTNIPQTTRYNLYTQVPDHPNPAGRITITLHLNQNPVDTLSRPTPLVPDRWNYLTTCEAAENDALVLEMKAFGDDQPGTILAADVLKISALVKDRDLEIADSHIHFGQVSIDDTATCNLSVRNSGIETLRILDVSSAYGTVFTDQILPTTVPPMEEMILPLLFHESVVGPALDTLVIASDDPIEPTVRIPVSAEVSGYFRIIDNEDTDHYREVGDWSTSVAQAYGSSSRFAFLNRTPNPWAGFFTTLDRSGIYEISGIVPSTVNSATSALHEFRIAGIVVDSVFIDQNRNSGSWIPVCRQYIPSGVEAELRIIDDGSSTGGDVLRADAVRFELVQEITDIQDAPRFVVREFRLLQNYPNPFNPVTTIPFHIPVAARVRIEVFDALGKHVNTLLDRQTEPGEHTVLWRGTDDSGNRLPSGIYHYRMQAGSFVKTNKMVFIR